MEGEGERERGGERSGARSDEGWEGVGRGGEIRTRQVEEGGGGKWRGSKMVWGVRCRQVCGGGGINGEG